MLTNTALTKAMQELAPPGVAFALWCDGEPPPLWRAELSAAASMTGKRQREFAAGRHCAREALAHLGHAAVALPVGPGRAPVWPPGIIGSISHTNDIAIAAVARRSDLGSLGIDVESADPLDPDLIGLVCSKEELAALADEGLQPEPGAKLIFSAKESVYKCLWPLTGMFLEFHAIRICIDSARLRFRVHSDDQRLSALARQIRGRYRNSGPVLVTCAWTGKSEDL